MEEFTKRELETACTSWSFSVLPLESAIEVVHALGFRYIDIGFEHLPLAGSSPPAKEGRALRRALSNHGMAISDLFLNFPYETNDSDPSHRDMNRKSLLQAIDIAIGSEAPGITIKPGMNHPGHETEYRNLSIDVLADYVSVASQSGIRLSIEPHVDSIAESPDRATWLVESVPGLEITLDYSHFVYCGFPIDTAEALHPFVRHVHLRQAANGRLQTRFSEGVIPIPAIAKLLLQNGYNGRFALEYQNSDWHNCNDIDVVTETVRTVQSLSAFFQ